MERLSRQARDCVFTQYTYRRSGRPPDSMESLFIRITAARRNAHRVNLAQSSVAACDVTATQSCK